MPKINYLLLMNKIMICKPKLKIKIKKIFLINQHSEEQNRTEYTERCNSRSKNALKLRKSVRIVASMFKN